MVKKWWELWHFGAIVGCFTFWKSKDFFNSMDEVKTFSNTNLKFFFGVWSVSGNGKHIYEYAALRNRAP